MLIDQQDLLYAVRSIRRTPLLTFVVVLALSVGIGLNAGVFTILDSFFLEPPTRKDPSSFVQIYPRYQGWYIGAAKDSSFNAKDYDAIHALAHSLADVAALANDPNHPRRCPQAKRISSGDLQLLSCVWSRPTTHGPFLQSRRMQPRYSGENCGA